MIIWLVSYHKSGNTWFRTFVSNLISEKDEPVNINSLLTDGIASGRELFDEMAGVESSDLTFEEIDELREKVYTMLAEISPKKQFIKVHDAYTYINDNKPMFPNYKSKCIYILRNPLDVAVSFSFHLSETIDETIKCMKNSSYSFCGKNYKLYNQLRQQMLSWSGHVKSWVECCEMPIHIIRYEDMLSNPFETFKKAVEFMEIESSDEKIKKAIEFSDFKILKKQEEQSSFSEKPPGIKSFFREGKSRSWEKYLSKEQIDDIISEHGEIMKKFRYLDEEGNII